MIARLPVSLELTDLVKNMKIGQRAYTLPWGMSVGPDRRCWLNGEYPAMGRPHETCCLPIVRTPEGFIVDARGVPHRWRPAEASPTGAWAAFPVIEIRWDGSTND